MSQQNLEVVQRLVALWEGDAGIASLRDDAAWARYKPGIEPFFEPDCTFAWFGGGIGPEYSGLDSFREGWLDIYEAWESARNHFEHVGAGGREGARAGSSVRSDSRGGARGRNPRRWRLRSARRQGRARRVLCGPCPGPRSRGAVGVGHSRGRISPAPTPREPPGPAGGGPAGSRPHRRRRAPHAARTARAARAARPGPGTVSRPRARARTYDPRRPQRRAAGVRTRDGTGLGLSIVRVIAEAHGGRAELVPGAGGTVRIWLPDRPDTPSGSSQVRGVASPPEAFNPIRGVKAR